MLRKLLLASSAVVLMAAFATPADASRLMHIKFRKAPTGAGNCPQGTADPTDGCAAVPAGASIQFPALLTSGDALQSGQTVTSTTPLATQATPSNEAGVDYPIGPGTPPGGVLKDPLNSANWPAVAFTCGTTDHGTYWVLGCGGASMPDFDWNGFDFRPNPARAQANKGPIYLEFDNGNAGNQTIENSYFALDDNCSGSGIQPAFIWQQNNVPVNFTVRSNKFDGNFAHCRLATMSGVNLDALGTWDIERNYFDHVPGRPVSGLMGSNPVTVKFNLFRDCETQPQQGHGECDIFEHPTGTTAGTITFAHNTIVLLADTFNGYTSSIYDTGLGGTMTDHIVDQNVVVVNTVGGVTGPLSEPATGTINNDAAGTGNVFTVTSGNPRIFPGSLFSGGGLNANVAYHVAGSPASGVGSKWGLMCIYNGCGTAHKADTSANFLIDIPDVNIAAATYTVDNGVTSAAGAEFGAAYHQIKFTGNFVDKTGDDFGRYWVMISGTCTLTTTFTGNKDLTTGAAINDWSLNAATGCQKGP